MMPQALRRSGPERRYPILMALLAEAHIDRGDELISQYENALGKVWRTAGRKLDELRKDTDRDKAALARLGVRLSRLVLDAHRRGEQTVEIAEIERDTGLDRLKAAVECNQKLQASAEAQRNDKLHEQISWLQKTAGRILRSVPLCVRDQDRCRKRWSLSALTRKHPRSRTRRSRRSPRGSATGYSTIAGVRSAPATSRR